MGSNYGWKTRPLILLLTAIMLFVGCFVQHSGDCPAANSVLPKYWIVSSLVLLSTGISFRASRSQSSWILKLNCLVFTVLMVTWLSIGVALAVEASPPQHCHPVFYGSTLVMVLASWFVFLFYVLFIMFNFFCHPADCINCAKEVLPQKYTPI